LVSLVRILKSFQAFVSSARHIDGFSVLFWVFAVFVGVWVSMNLQLGLCFFEDRLDRLSPKSAGGRLSWSSDKWDCYFLRLIVFTLCLCNHF